MLTLNLVTAPSVEPVTYAEAKAYLRLEHDADQALITSLITTARRLIENQKGRSFVRTTWEQYLDGFPYGGGYFKRAERYNYGNPNWLPNTNAQPISVPRSPLLSVRSIQYLSASTTWQTLDPSQYRVVAGSPGQILPVYGSLWPFPLPQDASVRVSFDAGFGDDASSVPETVKTAIKQYVVALYENRGEDSVPIPQAISWLLDDVDTGIYM
jgi:hypothetical protein